MAWVSCGKFICAECSTELGGRVYRAVCANEIFIAGRPAEAVQCPATAMKTQRVRKTAAGKAKAEEVTTEEKVSGAWWLMSVFPTCVGGVVV